MDTTDKSVKTFVKKNALGILVAAGIVTTIVVSNAAYIRYLNRGTDLLAKNFDIITEAMLDRIKN